MPLSFSRHAACALAAALLLAACEDEAVEAPRETGQGGEAAGEVLGGTISDEMVPLERLRSQSPPLEPEPGEGEGGNGAAPGGDADARAGDDAAEGEGEGDDTPAPAPASTALPVAPPAPD
ncbi:hypothetical protein [Erythrobacter sp. HL-111]|uniref:hypothetical protein n=1 Tax=Erythrobacter sp. HL-111 TaxID=1798193 RepID=UPI0006DA5A18|nr:hypothetical protein [Erythrobacter sp. HL-111]KPP88935.1 MAG: Tryptophan-associated transmembrane protein [Erythrobacteraceae bacterium HL-111]SDT04608.1 hypothetical protein SAMN04515621_2791 [Erythrobacter sp. HL-111]